MSVKAGTPFGIVLSASPERRLDKSQKYDQKWDEFF